MSRENVEVVERVYASFARGEPAEWAFDPDVEWYQREDLPDASVRTGTDGVVAMISRWEESFDGLSVESEPAIDHGEYVIVPLVVRAHIRETGNEVELPEVHVWRLRDEKVVEIREYRTKDEALAATPPPADPPRSP